jgi:hypothetical protein
MFAWDQPEKERRQWDIVGSGSLLGADDSDFEKLRHRRRARQKQRERDRGRRRAKRRGRPGASEIPRLLFLRHMHSGSCVVNCDACGDSAQPIRYFLFQRIVHRASPQETLHKVKANTYQDISCHDTEVFNQDAASVIGPSRPADAPTGVGRLVSAFRSLRTLVHRTAAC